MEILKNLLDQVGEDTTVRVYFKECPYKDLVKRAVAGESIAIRVIAHCLYWGKGGLINKQYALNLLKKLLIEDSDIFAEYLLAHYEIIDGNYETGRRTIRKLKGLNFQPAVTLDAYLSFRESSSEKEKMDAVYVLEKHAKLGYTRGWFLLLRCAREYSLGKRIRHLFKYALEIIKTNPFKKQGSLRDAEKEFLFN